MYFVKAVFKAVTDGTYWPISDTELELRQQKVVVELIDALDAGKYLWNDGVGQEVLLMILMQQLVMKHLHCTPSDQCQTSGFGAMTD